MRPVNPSPEPVNLAIGPKLRATRLAQGMTISQVGQATGFDKSFISRIERDQTSPSVTTLVTICQVLSLPIGSLFEPPVHQVVRLADAPRINFGGSNVTERLLTPRSESGLQLIRSSLHPGASGGDDFYTITCEVETVHVLAGRLTLRFPYENIQLTAGDALTLAGREPHTWINDSEQHTEVLWAIAPAAWSGSA